MRHADYEACLGQAMPSSGEKLPPARYLSFLGSKLLESRRIWSVLASLGSSFERNAFEFEVDMYLRVLTSIEPEVSLLCWKVWFGQR